MSIVQSVIASVWLELSIPLTAIPTKNRGSYGQERHKPRYHIG